MITSTKTSLFTSDEIESRGGRRLIVWISDVLADGTDHPVLNFAEIGEGAPQLVPTQAMICTDACIESALYMLRMAAAPSGYCRIEFEIFHTLATLSADYRAANRRS